MEHPIGVAWILWEIGGIDDINVLQAAVLHE
jgi:(p)ppGpp synthase/HD superfamily hydrolase